MCLYCHLYCSEPLEYKYIISNGDAVTWQPGGNLVLTLSEGNQVPVPPLLGPPMTAVCSTLVWD